MRRALAIGAVLLCVGTGTAFASDAECVLSPADKAANARLDFDEFDQKGVTPSTWRALEVAGCHDLAATAAEDYLVHGPVQTPDHKSDILFHIAQSLAFGGHEREAARMVAAAIAPAREKHGELDWTMYLMGTWAFLAKDRATLESAIATMAGEPGDSNRLDGGILQGLLRCVDKPYREAYVACRPPH